MLGELAGEEGTHVSLTHVPVTVHPDANEDVRETSNKDAINLLGRGHDDDSCVGEVD